MADSKLIFEKSQCGRKAYSLPKCDVEEKALTSLIDSKYLRAEAPELPEVNEVEVIRHYTQLSTRNYGVDYGFYPLGSCTMKYNPKIHEKVARLETFSGTHPLQDSVMVQGNLEVMYETEQMLSDITGMDRVCLQPSAGAHGELASLMMIKAYHEDRGNGHKYKMIVPDSAHGTNPASAAMVGYEVVEVKSNKDGLVDVEALIELMDDEVAGLMLTNPNTLGLFEKDIKKIAEIVHSVDGQLYYDGANMNAIMGVTSPGDMGFDVVHLNLHKTFTTPHGGGGPGAGPIGIKEHLAPFLPVPVILKKSSKSDEPNENNISKSGNEQYFFDYNRPKSIGKVKAFYGNFGVILRAYCYLLTMGEEGLRKVSEMAVLNANYMMHRLKPYYELPFNQTCMHEFVLSGSRQKEKGARTLDIAKRLLDYGYHPPTIYFPLIVEEAMMIEPTETETKETLDGFIEALIAIAKECEEKPEFVHNAPYNTYVRRLDEASAARRPVLIGYGPCGCNLK